MRVIIFNQKGGVGKSMLATQIALHFNAVIVELDPYGVLNQTLEGHRVVKVALDSDVPNVSTKHVVYDFGGFDDHRLDTISKEADLIIIPFNPTINALGTTIKSYQRASEQNLPILFVANAVLKEQDAIDAQEFLKEQINDEIELFVIPHTRALQTSENEGKSIIDLAKTSGLRRHTYRKISATMKELMQLISEYE